MLPLPQVECQIRHYFVPGLYAREITLPAGTVITGAIHKTENLVELSKGRVRVITDEGTEEKVAPCKFIVKPGQKNGVLALEESVWTNYHHNPTNETDHEKLAELFTHSKASELLGGADNAQLLANGGKIEVLT